MTRREGPTATGRSRFAPICASVWISLGCLLAAAGCLNPMPDNYPSGSNAVGSGDAPAFGGVPGGSEGHPSLDEGDGDFFDEGEPVDGPASNPPLMGSNESPADADAGAPAPDGGLKATATTRSTSRAAQDAGADAR